MAGPTVRAPLSRKRHRTPQSSEGGAVQSDALETNINRIVAQYRATGGVTHVAARQPLYGDFSLASDLHTQMERVRSAQLTYGFLPAAVRAVSDNDPVRFMEMFETEEGLNALTEAGLFVDDPVDEEDSPKPPSKASAVSDPPKSEDLPPAQADS